MREEIDIELKKCLQYLDEHYSLRKLSPLLFKTMKEFVLRGGKRARPIFFILAYKGFSKKPSKDICKSALSFELLHDFLLVHDDIIDKSDTRRGLPSAHRLLGNYLSQVKKEKQGRPLPISRGEDLAISLGDVMHALSIDVFLTVKENLRQKEGALKRFIEGAVYTGIGEFEELLLEVKKLDKITKEDIYKIYDLKTAYYTFACPLSAGAVLAGADKKQVDLMFRYGMCLGRAFQVQDDILGVFGDEKKTGKSSLTDLREGKKTILVWYAYNNSGKGDKKNIEKIMEKGDVNENDLKNIQDIINRSGSWDYSKKEISRLVKNAHALLESSKINPQYKQFLVNYSKKLFDI